MHRHLTQLLRFTIWHPRRVPHFLTVKQKKMRVQMANELSQVLSVQAAHHWHEIVTWDELWIYLFSEDDLMWTAREGIIADRERHTV
jgi:hypothetical protein